MMDSTLEARVADWIAGDPCAQDRAELEGLVRAGSEAQLRERFGGRLGFGTAGLRGPMGAGPARMNAAVVRQTTLGLACWLESQFPDAHASGVVVGFDGRHRSRELAGEVTSVLLARGFKVYAWDVLTPTPTTPWLLRARGACAGVQVTASHNPPADNGYKVYWDHGAQIIPPHDAGIARAIEEAARGPASAIPTLEPSEAYARFCAVGEAELAAYRAEVLEACPAATGEPCALPIVYTAMHGVGQATVSAVLAEAGFGRVFPVAEQGEPDGDFPTVEFPNPEEAGALDLAFAEADRRGAALIIANDPDADRLGVAVPRRGGAGWRSLTGNELGSLLGDYVLSRASLEAPVVVASIVSSEQLGAIAAHRGARFSQSLTGFKWIMAEARALEAGGAGRFAFGYEEALGYCVGGLVADKDGVSAALALCCLARDLAVAGRDLEDALDELADRHGAFVTAPVVERFVGSEAPQRMAAVMARMRASPPSALLDLPLWRFDDHAAGRRLEGGVEGPLEGPKAELLCLRYGARAGPGALRVLVRPSGTEPKVKAYLEWRGDAGRAAAQARLEALVGAFREAFGGEPR
jgi:phosphomannomutase